MPTCFVSVGDGGLLKLGHLRSGCEAIDGRPDQTFRDSQNLLAGLVENNVLVEQVANGVGVTALAQVPAPTQNKSSTLRSVCFLW